MRTSCHIHNELNHFREVIAGRFMDNEMRHGMITLEIAPSRLHWMIHADGDIVHAVALHPSLVVRDL